MTKGTFGGRDKALERLALRLGLSAVLALALGLGAAFQAPLSPSAFAEEDGAEQDGEDASGEDDTEEQAEGEDKKKKKKLIEDTVKDFEKLEGLFTLYRDPENGELYMTVRQDQLDTDYVYFAKSLDGVVDVGLFRGQYRDNRIIRFQKSYKNIEIHAENTRFYFDPDNALSRAKSANISRAIMATTKIVAENEEGTEFLIKADGIFLTETMARVKVVSPLARALNLYTLGRLAKDKTKYADVRSYPENTEIVVDYSYDNATPSGGSSEGVTDRRYVTVRFQHSFVKVPEEPFHVRFEDQRVGYFTDRQSDLTSLEATNYRDAINRWRLEKKDPSAEVSDPVKPITFWIENTTPEEFRDIVRDATLRWNEAFEAAGISNAIEVKVQPDDAEWDAGDIRYNVLRWTSSPNPPFGGYGPSFSNPRTGEILGADVMLEFVFVTNRIRYDDIFGAVEAFEEREAKLVAELGPRYLEFCRAGFTVQRNMLMGLAALEARGASEVEKTKLVEQSLYYLVLHEVGHTIGLQHNMRATHWRSPEEVYSTTDGQVAASVMDYPAIVYAPEGQEQNDYYNTRPGPYDVFAVEYGYRQFDDPEAEKAWKQELLAKSTQPQYSFGNDADDMRSPGKGIDPRVMIGDMSSDPVAFAADRVAFVETTLNGLKDRYLEEGRTWHELRVQFNILMGNLAASARVFSRQIGGVQVERFVIGQPGGTQPFEPVDAEQQKRAMAMMREHIFAPDAFEAAEGLYAFLQLERRGFDFFPTTEDYKVHQTALAIQQNALVHIMHPNVLLRLSDTRAYGNDYSAKDMLGDLTDAVFEDDLGGSVNTYRQTLQIDYVGRLMNILKSDDYDYVSKTAALAQLKRIYSMTAPSFLGLPAMVGMSGEDAETRAHRDHLRTVIKAVL